MVGILTFHHIPWYYMRFMSNNYDKFKLPSTSFSQSTDKQRVYSFAKGITRNIVHCLDPKHGQTNADKSKMSKIPNFYLGFLVAFRKDHTFK